METGDKMNDIASVGVPVGVSTLSILGVPLPDVVYILTIIYLCINMMCTIYKTYKQTRKK